MSDHDVANQATIAIQEVILSRLKAQDEVLHDILIQAKLTNGRVTTVERDFAVEKALRGRDRETDASATRERRITDEHQLQASLAKRASRGQLRSALAGAGASGLLLYIGHLVHFV